MKTFIVLYHAPIEILNQNQNPTQEEMEKGMEPWMQWAKSCGEQLVDLGKPLINGIKIMPDGSSKESDREVCGYSILKANSIEDAKGLLEKHPHISWNEACQIEVHECAPLPGM